MSILGQLERDLVTAARQRQATAEPREVSRAFGAWLHGLRVPALAFAALLASGTIALAASDLILTGSPVAPSNQRDSGVGNGVPAPGDSELLPLRVSDPEGGLPWGMRLVHTTRGKLCLQV